MSEQDGKSIADLLASAAKLMGVSPELLWGYAIFLRPNTAMADVLEERVAESRLEVMRRSEGLPVRSWEDAT